MKNAMDIMISYHTRNWSITSSQQLDGLQTFYFFSSLSWKDVLENNDRRRLEKNYAFSRFGPFGKISKVFPQTTMFIINGSTTIRTIQRTIIHQGQCNRWTTSKWIVLKSCTWLRSSITRWTCSSRLVHGSYSGTLR
jgi:hypothetical protein